MPTMRLEDLHKGERKYRGPELGSHALERQVYINAKLWTFTLTYRPIMFNCIMLPLVSLRGFLLGYAYRNRHP
jgi:hypothetical protein